MAEKRRDNKNRVLKSGESQRKDGRYMYKYTDVDGKVKYEYSWKLVPTDKMPAGKLNELSLREKIKEVEKRKEEGVTSKGSRMTVLQLVEEALAAKSVRKQTMINYRAKIRCHIVGSAIAGKKISTVNRVDAKAFRDELFEKKLLKSSAREVYNILVGAFKYGVEEEYVKRNPFSGGMKDYRGTASEKVLALTPQQKDAFFRFVQRDKLAARYADEIELMFETGLRVGEFAGLTYKNVDLEKKVIRVVQQRYHNGEIGSPKTNAGIREIPISRKAHECLLRIQMKNGSTREPDSYVACTRDGSPTVGDTWTSRFKSIRERWAKEDPENACRITPHVCRHTYCTDLIRAGVNPKAVQYLMGHSNLSVTMDIYASNNSKEDAMAEIAKVGLM